jgi:hypothetical protein
MTTMELVPVKKTLLHAHDPVGEDVRVGARFSVFNVQANRKVFRDFVDQRDIDMRYIEELESLLKNHNIQAPVRPECKVKCGATPSPVVDYSMQDGR